MTDATLETIAVYPIKSLDRATVNTATVVENGGLEWDRRYAIVDEDGMYVNGKREPLVHTLEASFSLGKKTVTMAAGTDDRPRTFSLETDRDALSSWLTDVFGQPVSLIRDDAGGFPDDTDAAGPTVLSQGTLEAVAGWFDGIDAVEMGRRLRPNLVLSGVDPFWEDRLYEGPGAVVPFEIGDCSFHGVNPCQRCVVPTRHPDTGAITDGFRERFVDRREATLPPWASRAWFDHYFRLMVNTRVPAEEWGATLSVGDRITAGESIADPNSR